MCRHSLVIKTMYLLKSFKLELEGEQKDAFVKVLDIVNDILRDCEMAEGFHDSGIVP